MDTYTIGEGAGINTRSLHVIGSSHIFPFFTSRYMASFSLRSLFHSHFHALRPILELLSSRGCS
jgi:hypothetical protein